MWFEVISSVVAILFSGYVGYKLISQPEEIIYKIDNEGFYKEGDIVWDTGADPSMLIAVSGATILHMLHPDVVRFIEESGKFYKNPRKRIETTFLYGQNVTFGRKEIAKKASEHLQKVHNSLSTTHPSMGIVYSAAKPELLLWVHNTLVWCILRTFRKYGPKLTIAEEDRYVKEQNITGELAGIPTEMLHTTVEGLDKYMDKITKTELGFTMGCLHFKKFLESNEFATSLFQKIIDRFFHLCSFTVMSDLQQELLGEKMNIFKKICVEFFGKVFVNILRKIYLPRKVSYEIYKKVNG